MRLLRRVLLVLLLTLVLLEATLQGAALVFSWLGRRGPVLAPADGVPTVLCVGDSYTQGDGATASEHSYPMVLQRLLAERHGIRARVVNAGWRGQDSRDVLATLPQALRDSAAQVVCVVVGCNDLWNRPPRLAVAAEESAGGFRWRLRSWRLLKLLLTGIGALHDRPAPAVATAAPAAGPPTEAMVAAARALLREAGLLPEPEPPQLPPAPAPEVAAGLAAGQTHFHRGELREAIAAMDELLQRAPDEAAARRLVVEAASKLGDRERVARELDRMRQRHAADASLANTEHLAWALWQAADADAAQALASAGVQQFPRAPGLWRLLGETELRRDQERCALALHRFLQLVGPIEPWHTGQLASIGRCIAGAQPDVAARVLLAALLLGGEQRGPAWAGYLIASRSIPAATMLAYSAPAGLDERGLALLRSAHDEVYGTGDKAWLGVLQDHLLVMAERARAAGAQIVFGSYPFLGDHQAALRAAAEASAAPFVPVHDRFARELQTRPREQLFVADGHCTDAGYAIMAEEFAAIVARLLRP